MSESILLFAEELGSHADRHDNIGNGKIGMKGFGLFMNDKRFDGVPVVLETPLNPKFGYDREMISLYELESERVE